MLQKHQQGFTLIEIIIFMVVLGIVGSGLLVGLNQSIRNSYIPRSMPQSNYLANARLQVILMYRHITGYSISTDPCTTNPSYNICGPLATYATNNQFTVLTPTFSGTNPKTITVNVTGIVNATAVGYVYNYGNN